MSENLKNITSNTTVQNNINPDNLQTEQIGQTQAVSNGLVPDVTLKDIFNFLAPQTSSGNSVTGGPNLAAPNPDSINKLMNVSPEALMSMIDYETRKTDLNNSKVSIESISKRRQTVLKQMSEKLDERIKKEEAEKNKSFWQKLLSGIGQALGIVASIVTIAVGAATGCPLLIAAGVAGALFTIDSMVQTFAGDGAMSLFLGLFMNKDTARFVAGIIDTVGAIACSIAGGYGATIGLNLMVACGSKMAVACKVINIGAAAISGLSNVAKGGIMIDSAFEQRDIEYLRADRKKQQAILEQLQFSLNFAIDNLKANMEKFQKVTEGVKDTIDGLNQTTTAVVTNGAANPA